jgi:hypothetical protein
MPRSWGSAEDAQLRDLHARGLSLNACVASMGWSLGTISNHAKKLGLSWDRSKTKAATAAHVIDNKALRASTETRLLVKANEWLDQTSQPCTLRNFGGKDNTLAELDVDQPAFIDIKHLMSSASLALTASLRIAAHDVDTSANLAAVDKWLNHMTEGGQPGDDSAPADR